MNCISCGGPLFLPAPEKWIQKCPDLKDRCGYCQMDYLSEKLREME